MALPGNVKIEITSEEYANLRVLAAKAFSENYSGENSPLFGKSFSEDHCRHISESAKVRLSVPENNPMFGKHHSENAKKKMSEKRKEYYKTHPGAGIGKKNGMFGKHHTEA